MFTINIYLKFAIIIVCLISAVVLTATISFWYALPFYLIGFIFIASYLFLGTVQSAAKMMEQMDFEACQRRLNLTFRPKWLYVTNRAFYYIIKGTIALNTGNNKEAEEYFNIAKDLKLPSDTERAMVLLQLANINAGKGKWAQAKSYFLQLKKYKVTEPQLKEQIKQFEKALSNRGQMKHAQTGGFRGGGKRPRPKVR